MSINSLDLIKIAETLSSMDSEAAHRSATSRAYYAAYHACAQWESELSMVGSNTGPQGGIHQQLVNRLKNPAPEIKDLEKKKLSRILSMLLDSLRIQRKMADYSITEPYDSSSAINHCETSKIILEKIGVIKNSCETDCQVDSEEVEKSEEQASPTPTDADNTPKTSRPSLKLLR
jgi:uncharacterized protein (UPF0332 family)